MEHCDVAVVGGGPVGLLLGAMLTQRGLEVRVFERTDAPRAHSRAIGIHPPGLACLAEVGAAESILASGVRVRRGLAFGSARALGKISFGTLPGPYPFVLCAPQSETERVLEARLVALAPRALRRGVEVLSCSQSRAGVTLDTRTASGRTSVQARFAVGCDGKHSRLRSAAGIAFPGRSYGEHFVMADVDDDTPFGQDAAVFLTREGVVESFPLPRDQRRWVIGLGQTPRAPSAELVEELVCERTGELARARSATMVSSFVAEHYLADRFVSGSIALAGDAAHVLSPIGGQGMNLGWLDAKCLAERLAEALHAPARAEALLARYAQERRRAARTAIRRAELFMSIGQTRRFVPVRDVFVEGLLSPWMVQRAAQVFTMQGLASAPA
jgi:2-polyprenyl-6-methoxyphenol hydroxylase-like FAD-dependent oxidoreductase